HCQRSRAFGCSAYRQSGTAEIDRWRPKMRPTFFGRARGRQGGLGWTAHQLLLAPAAWLPCALDRRLASVSVSSKAIIALLSKTRPIARPLGFWWSSIKGISLIQSVFVACFTAGIRASYPVATRTKVKFRGRKVSKVGA